MLLKLVPKLERETRLAHAARPRERDKPGRRRAQHDVHPGKVVLPPDQRGQRNRQVPAHCTSAFHGLRCPLMATARTHLQCRWEPPAPMAWLRLSAGVSPPASWITRRLDPRYREDGGNILFVAESNERLVLDRDPVLCSQCS